MSSEQNTYKRKKVKICGDITYENSIKDWTQCCFLLPKKMKLCNIGRCPGSLYCGNHKFNKSTESDNERDTLSHTKKGPRISCPIDPSHTIYSTNLQKHILVCAATTKTMKMKSKPYYIENCNADQSSATRQPPPIESGTTFDLLISKINLAYQNMVDRKGLCTHVESKQQLPPPPSPDTDAQPIDFEAVAENIRIKLRSNGVNSLESASNDEPLSAYWRLRHVEQDVALVKELISRGIVDTKSSSNSIFLEVGAGKGLLGLAVGVTQPKGRFVFLEKAGSRKKIDRYFRDNGILFERIVMDIRHCYLPLLPFMCDSGAPTTGAVNGSEEEDDGCKSEVGSNRPQQSAKHIAVIAKHLCGAATDLTLRSLLPFAASEDCPVVDLCIATCCHHVCNYADYVGKEWIHSQGFSADEFPTLRSWSSWFSGDPSRPTVNKLNEEKKAARDAILSDEIVPSADTQIHRGGVPEGTDDYHCDENFFLERDASDHDPPPLLSPQVSSAIPSLSKAEMSVVGMKIKRILDYGRMLFIHKELHLDAEVIEYCSATLSPENYAIITTPKPKR